MIHALRLLLPCHSLEDFPTFHEGEDAENLLVAWTAPWHPILLHQLQKVPEFGRVENSPESCTDQVFLIPKVSLARVPGGFRDRCRDQGGVCLDSLTDRTATVTELAQVLGCASEVAKSPPETARPFFALSYTYLQIELLTRQLRYTSNLDQAHFQSLVLKAATAATQGDSTTAEEALGRCFDLLAEERHRYYPMQSLLCDLTLLAPTTLGPALTQQVQRPTPINLLATADLLEHVQKSSPELWSQIRTACAERRLLPVGGGYNQAPLGLLANETLSRNLAWGQQFLSRSLGTPARVFARRLPGLEATLPGPLLRYGFRDALHEAFQPTRLPQTSHTYLRWQGVDGETIPSLTKTIYDANSPQSFLRLGIRIGECLDVDHVAASQFVHWPGQWSIAYEDLMESAARCDALGQWCLLDDLIAQINDPGYSPTTSTCDYRASYLKLLLEDAEADRQQPKPEPSANEPHAIAPERLVQEVQRLVRREHELQQTTLLSGLARLAGGAAAGSPPHTTPPAPVNEHAGPNPPPSESLLALWERLLPPASTIEAQKTGAEQLLLRTLTTEGTGYRLLVNSSCQTRRVLLSPDDLGTCHPGALPPDQVYAAYQDRRGWWAVVDVPSFGYLHFSTQTPTRKGLLQPRRKLVANKTTLRNEFLSAAIDPNSGALRSVHDYRGRSNLCSLQLSWFDQDIKNTIAKLLKGQVATDWKQSLSQLWGAPDTDGRRRQMAFHAEGYTTMKAQSLEVVTNHPLLGHVRTRGQMLLMGKVIAKFEIDYRLHLGSRFLHITGQVTPTTKAKLISFQEDDNYEFPPSTPLAGSGFRRYFGWRFAHAHPSAEVFRDLNGWKLEATRPTTEAPRLIEFQNMDQSLALLTGGLAFHRFPTDGRCDLLHSLSHQETVQAEIAIGVSPKNSLSAAHQFLDRLPVLPCGPLRPGLPSGAWLFRCSSKHVLVSDWENRYQGDQWLGVRVRLLETAGRSRKIKLEFAGNPTDVRATLPDAADPPLQKSLPTVRLEEGQVICQLGPCEVLDLEVDFGSRT
jgi:alpha-mannosidase